jgi:excinuclease UvrABC ATPase subunit
MSILSILSKNEQEKFVAEPTFTLQEKKYFFKVPELLLLDLNSSKNKVIMTLLWGYFKATNRFYVDFKQKSNIEFVVSLYNYECKNIQFSSTTLYRYKEKIKQYLKINEYTDEIKSILQKEANNPKKRLDTLHDVGLGYIKLGQQATTLSGGEAQRIKLSTELSKTSTKNTVYFLDEPTTGLHVDDIQMLLSVLQKLVDQGNTIIVIEHNLDVVKCADWVIDLGPEGGEGGGTVVAQGTVEELSMSKSSITGKFLKKVLK